jgi:uncharacterized membrane protein
MPQRVRFRNRAHEVSRLEAFSDVVFGFALTLIVVSLEVPKTYAELIAAMQDFPAFALCFAILIWIWHAHYTYFRRYGLHDEFTIWMNTFLLFLVLFYVYPLKFVFASFAGHRGYGPHEARVLFTIYGLGFAGIFFIYTLLYSHALKKRDELELNAVEQHDTQTHVLMFAGNVAIGVASILLALMLPDHLVGIAGYIYFLTGFVSWYLGTTRGSQRREVEASMDDPTAAR